ncbi:MAG TPA: hypothetical protein VLH86_04185 [Patescibacteria group bacterium]|nr:hypothetical protein [Patescibacteria group bacterium]
MDKKTLASANKSPELLSDIQNRKAVIARAKYGVYAAAYYNPEFVKLWEDAHAMQVSEQVSHVAVGAVQNPAPQEAAAADPRIIHAEDVNELEQQRRLGEARRLRDEALSNG